MVRVFYNIEPCVRRSGIIESDIDGRRLEWCMCRNKDNLLLQQDGIKVSCQAE